MSLRPASVAWSAILTLLAISTASAQEVATTEPVTLESVVAPGDNRADEPLAAAYSLENATRFLDSAALDWQKSRQCMTCHTNYAYLMARPAIGVAVPAHAAVRDYAEKLVTERWPDQGPRWDAEVVMTALALASNDAATTGKLHPVTKVALDRMWTLQREDGGWNWLKCQWPPMESDDDFAIGVVALAAGIAPDSYADTPAAQAGMEKLRGYLRTNPPPTLHHRLMLLWASQHVDNLLTADERQSCIDELLALQRPDGGWNLPSLGNWPREDGSSQDTETSDGYATGFAVYVLRQSGLPTDDGRLGRGVAWLKANQRESGRWFTRSLFKDSKHYLSHYGTAFAVLALQACEPAAAATQSTGTIDRARAVSQEGDPNLWYDIRELTVEGRGWTDTKGFFDRLPARAEGVVRAPVWGLSQHSAGMYVRFVTDATTISAQWTLRSDSLAMNHMPATGVSGVDLYVRQPDGRWTWLGVGRPAQLLNQQTLVSGLPSGVHEFLLYLPLYNGVEEVKIGLPLDASLAAAPAYAADRHRPIVFYGTSITQGGCASRPGMAYPAILGRRLDRPTINLGFSGNGQAESEVADLLAELDPAVFVIDCLPNLDALRVTERMGLLVEKLRAARPDTPIILVENIAYQNGDSVPASKEQYVSKNTALRAVVDRLLASGMGGLHYVEGETLLGTDGEGTVDGTHPTDLGFLRMADALEAPIRAALGEPSSGGQ